MQPETRFKNKVLPILREIPNSWWVKIQQKTIVGTPDILGVINSVMVAWELKTDKGKLAPIQQHNLDRINAAGGWARVVSPKNLEEELNHLYKMANITPKRQ